MRGFFGALFGLWSAMANHNFMCQTGEGVVGGGYGHEVRIAESHQNIGISDDGGPQGLP